MSDTFLPKGTKIPSTNNYLKLQQGENTFRVLAPAVIGFEYFNDKNKPIRLAQEPVGLPNDIGYKDGKPNAVRYFWAFPIWNYNDERVQIAEFTQKTIMVPLEAYYNNSKWGDLRDYDITITKKGSTMSDTEYAVMANPKEKIDQKIIDMFTAKKIDLKAWFDGADPFNSDGKSTANVRQANGMPVGVEYPKEEINPNDIPF